MSSARTSWSRRTAFTGPSCSTRSDSRTKKSPQLLVHGYVNIAGAKMSKSLGNIVDPDALADQYGPEALRYYLMRDCTMGQDMEFAEERLVQPVQYRPGQRPRQSAEPHAQHGRTISLRRAHPRRP